MITSFRIVCGPIKIQCHQLIMRLSRIIYSRGRWLDFKAIVTALNGRTEESLVLENEMENGSILSAPLSQRGSY